MKTWSEVYKPLQRTNIATNTAQRTDTAISIRNLQHLSPHDILTLQRTVGNQATQRLLMTPTPTARIQRLPRRKDVTKVLGEPKKDTKGFFTGKTKAQATTYRPVLDALDHFDTFIMNTTIANTSGGVMAQFSHLLILFQAIYDAAANYVAEKEGKFFGNKDKVAYMSGIMSQVLRERVVAAEVAHRMARQAGTRAAGMPQWFIALTGAKLGKSDPVQLAEGNLIGDHGGGINVVSEFKQDNMSGFFKGGKSQMQDPMTMPPETSSKDREAAGKEFYIAEDFGINANDPKLAQRDLAMARLDQLLGAGIIAKTELAIRNVGGLPKSGSLMEKAKGTRAGDTSFGEGPGSATKGNIYGPGLQRHLSRLQLIDVLAMQADRHMGNFFLVLDAHGDVVDLAGIDNDMSFGTRDIIDNVRQEFPGISGFVDAELAERIIALKPEDLIWILQDLLSPAEVDAAVLRLRKLQAFLKQLKQEGKLLRPDQWNKVTAEGMNKENSSYYGKLLFEYNQVKSAKKQKQGAIV